MHRKTIDRKEHKFSTADRRILQRELTQILVKFQKPPKIETSPKTHQLKGPLEKYPCASKIKRKKKHGSIAEFRLKMCKIESDDKDNYIDCCKKLVGKPVFVYVDNELKAE